MALDYLTRIDEYSSISGDSDSCALSLTCEDSPIPSLPGFSTHNEKATFSELLPWSTYSNESPRSVGSSDNSLLGYPINRRSGSRRSRSKSRVFNTCTIRPNARVKKTSIDGYILYLPNLNYAVDMWRTLSLHTSPLPPLQKFRRSGLVTTLQTYERFRERMIYLTEFNTSLFPESRRKSSKAKAVRVTNTTRRNSSYSSWQIIAKNYAREQSRLRELVGTVETRRSDNSLTPIRYSMRSPGTCGECSHGKCTCEVSRIVVSAPLGKRTLIPDIAAIVKRKASKVCLYFYY